MPATLGRAKDSEARGGVPQAPWSAHGHEGTACFGFVLVGGCLVGAQVRDVRLANEFSRRGYPVHVWWALDRPRCSPLAAGISQRWLFNAGRYGGWLRIAALDDWIGQWLSRVTSDRFRQQIVQGYSAILDRQLRELIRVVCNGVSRDERLIRRFASELAQRNVTHVVPNLECLAPFVAEAKRHIGYPLRYVVTFQGYELYAGYAQEMRQEARLYERLAEAVSQSDFAAIAVSDSYAERISSEVGISRQEITTIPAGAPIGEPMDPVRAVALLKRTFPGYCPELPLVTFVGRRDSEKGIDLLLYAARILLSRGHSVQLAVCGPTAFGREYAHACRQIAWNMRLPVLWNDFVSDDSRSALFRASCTVVCPSIHEEPFGMVPIEAMAQGTPVLVPDRGGVASLVEINGRRAGLRFRTWDSGDLANQLERLLTDATLRAALASDACRIAAHFSVEKMGERVLDHLGLPYWCEDHCARRSPSGATIPA